MATFQNKSSPGVQLVYEWVLGNAETGEAKAIGHFPDKSYAMCSTAWGGATVVLQGNWDNSNSPDADGWLTLTETDNTTAISNTSNSNGAILENPVWIRPQSSGGSGTSVKVVITAPMPRG